MANQSEKNLRPYAVSVDWLQLYFINASGLLNPKYDTLTHHFVDVGHGSKVFREIYDVYDQNGECIGNISLRPYSSAINPAAVIFKAENAILYESDYIQRIFMFAAECGLVYKGITRLDIAYDCQEFYGGLSPQNLLDRYFKLKYLKLGNNSPWVKFDGGYSLKFRSGNSTKIKLEGDTNQIKDFRCGSATWGNRSSDVQVQCYNKSKELRDVKMKHHIVEWWKLNGMDPDAADVYRVEIRITGLKTLKNKENGKLFRLEASELIMQEQIELLFASFASRYFRFYHRRDISHIERMPELKLFCHRQKDVLRPIHKRGRKDYTRQTKITMNYLDRQIYENAKAGNRIVPLLVAVRQYMQQTYQVGEELAWEKHLTDPEQTIFEHPEDYSKMIDYYAEMFAGADNEICEKASKARAELERKAPISDKELKEYAELLQYAEEDPSTAWTYDLVKIEKEKREMRIQKMIEDGKKIHILTDSERKKMSLTKNIENAWAKEKHHATGRPVTIVTLYYMYERGYACAIKERSLTSVRSTSEINKAARKDFMRIQPLPMSIDSAFRSFAAGYTRAVMEIESCKKQTALF